MAFGIRSNDKEIRLGDGVIPKITPSDFLNIRTATGRATMVTMDTKSSEKTRTLVATEQNNHNRLSPLGVGARENKVRATTESVLFKFYSRKTTAS
jgi:hypothetical protein